MPENSDPVKGPGLKRTRVGKVHSGAREGVALHVAARRVDPDDGLDDGLAPRRSLLQMPGLVPRQGRIHITRVPVM